MGADSSLCQNSAFLQGFEFSNPIQAFKETKVFGETLKNVVHSHKSLP